MRIDTTYAPVHFGYTANERDAERSQDAGGGAVSAPLRPCVRRAGASEQADGQTAVAAARAAATLPAGSRHAGGSACRPACGRPKAISPSRRTSAASPSTPCSAPTWQGRSAIAVTDPYIRLFYQARNLMELLETIARHKADDDEVAVHLVTVADEFKGEQQGEYFAQMQAAAAAIGIHFTWEYDGTGTIHARHIVTDTGWKILLDRGLDIFQHYEMNDAFAFANRLQQYRACKAFEVTYLCVA